MSAAQRYIPNYTVEDYLGWEGDWELWSGIPVSMSPSPFGRHQAIAARVVYELHRAILESGCHAEVLHEIDWIVSDETVVRPDVLVSCDGVPDRHVQNPPGLVVEVLSETTRERDLTFKQTLYRDFRVGTYLIVDPDDNSIVMWTRDPNDNWHQTQPAGQIELRPCGDCVLTVDCNRFFP
ncbi:Uma2 family endonuclease [Rhodopirellula sp. JC639]|uniref:Uma2 family endonuclease n=1 Tax=Stieleria mannarensis TaxID=2755585 RepID=UPI0015FF0535|nr:Uma2 family endonuclease [Rhodopirellula sp. JC639]